jgi:hypothetical protein
MFYVNSIHNSTIPNRTDCCIPMITLSIQYILDSNIYLNSTERDVCPWQHFNVCFSFCFKENGLTNMRAMTKHPTVLLYKYISLIV